MPLEIKRKEEEEDSLQKFFIFSHNKMQNIFKIVMGYIVVGKSIVHEIILKTLEKYLQLYIFHNNIISRL